MRTEAEIRERIAKLEKVEKKHREYYHEFGHRSDLDQMQVANSKLGLLLWVLNTE